MSDEITSVDENSQDYLYKELWENIGEVLSKHDGSPAMNVLAAQNMMILKRLDRMFNYLDTIETNTYYSRNE